jgi:DNA-binding MarR family transcriptional regulator
LRVGRTAFSYSTARGSSDFRSLLILFCSVDMSIVDARLPLITAVHANLNVMEDNQRHGFGLIAESWGDVLRRIRKYTGENWTLNQCIIMHAIFSNHLHNRECTVHGLVESEDIPQQTVSNAVTSLRASGMIIEKVHPDDGRIRLLFPSTSALELRNRVWAEAIGLSPAAPKSD